MAMMRAVSMTGLYSDWSTHCMGHLVSIGVSDIRNNYAHKHAEPKWTRTPVHTYHSHIGICLRLLLLSDMNR